MDAPLTMFLALVLLAVAAAGFVLVRLRFRGLSAPQRRELLRQWDALEEIDDAARRVLEADSILNRALDLLGYEGSLGEKLQKMGERFSDLDAVWAAHKLRNRIAHEPGLRISREAGDRAVARLRRAFDELC